MLLGCNNYAALQCASQYRCGIYGLGRKSIKLLHDEKNSQKSEFLGFYLYFCHVVQSSYLFFCNTKTSGISDTAKSRTTFLLFRCL